MTCPCCGRSDRQDRNRRAGNAMVACTTVGLVGILCSGIGDATVGGWYWIVVLAVSAVVFLAGGLFARHYDPDLS